MGQAILVLHFIPGRCLLAHFLLKKNLTVCISAVVLEYRCVFQYPRGFGGSGIGGHGYVNSGVQRKLNFAELKDIMWRKSAHSLIKQLASDVSNSSSSEQQRRIRTAAVIDRTAPTTIRRHRSQSTGRSGRGHRKKKCVFLTRRIETCTRISQ